jgi:Flp pilus assembly protein TadD
MPGAKHVKVLDIKEIKENRSGKISCCMIARDEEDCIARAIESVMDLAAEVIVVDTGSVDRTVPIARACGARVFQVPWEQDFSRARNYSLAKATSEWIFVLDADEVIDEPDHARIRGLIARHPDGAFAFEQRTYSNASSAYGWNELSESQANGQVASGYFRDRQVRLFRNERFIRYHGGVHEHVEDDLTAAGIAVYPSGIVIHHYGRLNASERVYRKSLAYCALGRVELGSTPGSVRFLMEMAAQLLALGRIDGAIEHALCGIAIEPRNWELLNLLGLAYLKRRKRCDAERCFREALAIGGANHDLCNNLGVALMDQRRYVEALELFERGLCHRAESMSLLCNSAIACCALDRVDDAAVYVQRALAIDPFAPGPHTVNAETRYRSGDFEGAAAALEKIRFLPGMQLRDYLKVIHLYIQMERVREAGEVLSCAIADYPDVEQLQYLRAKVFELEGEDEKAASVLRKLLARQPANADILNSLGCIYDRRGEPEKAFHAFGEAYRLSPSNARIEMNLGIALGKLGRAVEAEARLRHAVECDPNNGAGHHALGCHLANQERYLESLRHFARAVELEPQNADFYLNFGLACEKANMPGEAVHIYEQIASVDPQAASVARARLERLCAPV